QEPPTAITASADCTMIALRAWPWLVTTATDRSGFAPTRSGPGRMPTTSPPAARAPAATAAITPLPPPHSTTAPRRASNSPTRRAAAASVAVHRAGPHTATCTGRVYADPRGTARFAEQGAPAQGLPFAGRPCSG